MDIKSIAQSKTTKWVLIVVGVLIAALAVFQLGAFVGFHKAGFSREWGENYERNFGGGRGQRGGMMNNFLGKDFVNGHGTTGDIAKIEGNTLIIKDQDNLEKKIVVTNTTAIRSGRDDVKVADMKIGDRVVIIGAPQADGSVQAQIIRIFDPTLAPGMMGGGLPPVKR